MKHIKIIARKNTGSKGFILLNIIYIYMIMSVKNVKEYKFGIITV